MTTSAPPVLTGTTALVTGASSGIGEATAVALAAQGAAVALVARRTDRLQELATRIERAGGTALVLEADVTDRAQAQDAVAQTVERLGRLDLLVNNAGVALGGEFVDLSAEEFDWALVNYAPLTVGGALILFGGWYLISARRWFTGPVREAGTEAELTSIERQLER